MNYIEIKNEVIENLKQILIESFVEFYGKEHRNKIESVINKLVVVSYAKNEDNSSLEKEINNSKKNNDLLKLSYYELIKKSKENDEDVYVFLSSTSYDNIETAKVEVKNEQNEKVCGWSILEDELPIIYIRGFYIKVMTLIHEINHFLSKEKLGEISFEELNVTFDVTYYGVLKDTASFDLVYEIFNELMSVEILEIFKKRCNDEELLDLKIENSSYLNLDRYCLNIVSDTYNMMKDVIKDRLIVGNGLAIKKILGDINYKGLNIFLGRSMNELRSTLAIDDSLTVDDCISNLSDEKIRFINERKASIENSYNQYLEYQNHLSVYVDELVNDGNGRKII